MILGIDLSLRSTGICILDLDDKRVFSGSIPTKKTPLSWEQDAIQAGINISNTINSLVQRYEVTDIYLEGLSLNSKGSSTRTLPLVMGIVIGRLGQPVEILPISTIKLFATGKGNASKEDMLAAIEPEDAELFNKLTPLPKRRFDIADAFWIAKLGLTHVHSKSFNRLN